jgi:hypothetical protein
LTNLPQPVNPFFFRTKSDLILQDLAVGAMVIAMAAAAVADVAIRMWMEEMPVLEALSCAAVLTVALMVGAMVGARPKRKELWAAALTAAMFFAAVAAMLALPVTMEVTTAVMTTVVIWDVKKVAVVKSVVSASLLVMPAALLAVTAMNLALELPAYVGKYVALPEQAAHLCARKGAVPPWIRISETESCAACTDISAARVGSTNVSCPTFHVVTIAFMAADLLAAVLLVVWLARMAWRLTLQEHRWRMLVLRQHQMAAAPAALAAPAPVLPHAAAAA